MSAREKKTTLYSRNGIKIEKNENILKKGYIFKHGSTEKVIERVLIESKERIIRTGKRDYEVKKESPLGFYYYKPLYYHNNKGAQEKHICASFETIYFQLNDKSYYLEYPTKYKDVGIGIETRPWDILPGYKGIFNHFITDLYKELNKFFDLIEDNNKLLEVENLQLIKDTTFKDIFGNPKGPSTNYNDIKILSHGFDLKESFRKRKEN